MTEYQKVLNKAKQKYKDAVRGYECQKELMFGIDNLKDYIFLEKRRDVFKAEFTILEDVFGLALFAESTEVLKPKNSVYSPRVQEITNEIDIKMQQLIDLEDKIARR